MFIKKKIRKINKTAAPAVNFVLIELKINVLEKKKNQQLYNKKIEIRAIILIFDPLLFYFKFQSV